MANIVHQLSSSDDDSEDSLPNLVGRVSTIRRSQETARYSEEPEAVDLTLSSDTEDATPKAADNEENVQKESDGEDCILEATDMDEGLQEANDMENNILEETDFYDGIEDANDMGNYIYDANDMDEGMQEAEDIENCILEATDMDEGMQEVNDKENCILNATDMDVGMHEANDMENCILDVTDLDSGKQEANEVEEGILEATDVGFGTLEAADMDDIIVEAVREQPKESFSPPRHKAPRLNTKEPEDDEICLLDDVPSLQVSEAGYTNAAAKKPRKALTKEDREAAKQQREEEKQRRAALREQRAKEKAAEKERREEERRARKAMKPGECLKLLVVELDRRLVEAAEGGRVLTQLQEGGLTYRIVDGRVAAAVTFFRVDPLSGKESQAEESVVMMKVEDFSAAVRRQVYGGGGEGSLCQLCKQWKATLGTPNLALVVCGIDEYFRKQALERQRQIRSAGPGKSRHHGSSSNSLPRPINRVDMETAVVVAQMECRVNHRFMSDGGKAALYILQVAKAVAELPFKREKGEALFSWYAEGSSVNSVKVDRSGVGLFKLWQQQLRQFNHVGIEVAQAVTSKYPSPMALIQAYRRCGSQREAEQLVADLRVRRSVGPLASEQRVGKEFSRKLYLFLTSTNPDQPLAANT